MGRRRTSAALAATAWLLAATSTAAIAQPGSRFTFDLKPETLSQALRDVAVQSGSNIVAPDALLEARRAPALSGTFTVEQAVTKLLQGSGLQYRQVGNSLVVEAASFPSASNTTQTAGLPSITVTGTRIRGVGSASPVMVTTREQLEQAGINNLADFTRILPQNYTGGQNPGIAGGGEQGGQINNSNSATLNLRGLGPDATLTLLNGHRLSYDALDQGIDISAIPLGAIERIEVVGDGASALYGSDAVGGVANIILRRDYEGLETSARVGGATDGGDFQQEYSLVGGKRWSSGGFMIALDESSATPITAGQRDYTRTVDPSLTLTTRNRQFSGVVSGHQKIAPGLSLDLDGYLMNRRSLKTNPFTATASAYVNGTVNQPHVLSYALTPTLRADLGSWQASLNATQALSRTLIDGANYSKGIPKLSNLLYQDRLSSFEATAEGPLFTLPGGDARLAVGGGLRRVSLHDHVSTIVNGLGVTTTNFTQRRDVRFAYGELSLPIARPELNLPLVERLTVTGALRYERWIGIDAVTTPKVGLIYQPIGGVTVRATWGRSFKVPTLFQINQVEQGALIPGIYFSPAPRPAGSTVLLLGGGSPTLKPERATTWSGTLELKPNFIPGLDLQGSYFQVNYLGRIATPLSSSLTALFNPLYNNLIDYNPSAAQVNSLIATLPQGLMNETGAPFDPSDVGAIIDTTLRNTARERIHGLDLNADYRLDTRGAGTVTMIGEASYLNSAQQLAANRSFVELAGTIFNPPHWRGRVGAVWDQTRTSFSVFANYLGATTDNRFPVTETVPAFVTLDLSASIRTGANSRLLRNLEIRFSALNVLNEEPHVIRTTAVEEAPYDSTNESPVGRFVGISIRKAW